MHPQSDQKFIPPWRSAALPHNTPVLLALSGGADSALLLHLLSIDAEKNGYSLHAAHVNHGIRGEEADRDEQFCHELAKKYGCTLHVLHADIPAIAAQSKKSVEHAARDVRYGYFERLMRELGIPLLATAHHADDNLETVLLRLLRGSSTAGLAGIAPCRPFGDGFLTRPLLCLTRQEILTLCEKEHLAFVIDSTNADPSYTRNFVRSVLSPAMETLTNEPQRQVLRTCELLREDDALLYDMAQKALVGAHCGENGLLLCSLRAQPIPVRRRMLVLLMRQAGIDAPERTHLEALLSLIDQHGEAHADLPDARRATADGTRIFISSKQTKKKETIKDYILPLQSGHHVYDDLCVSYTLTTSDPPNDGGQQNIYNPFIRDTITFDKINSSAYFRPRREGDVILLGGMHRKVRKLQNEHNIPSSLRERIPLLCDSDGILWVPFVGKRDGCTPCETADAATKMHLTIHIRTDNESHSCS